MKNFKLIIVLLFFISATSLTAQDVKKSTTKTTSTAEEKTITRHKKAPSKERVKFINKHPTEKSNQDRWIPQKPTKHFNNSIIQHRRTQSKLGEYSITILEDVEFDKIHGVTSVDKHRKRDTKKVYYLKYEHKKGFSKNGVYEIPNHNKQKSSLEIQKAQKHKRKPSKAGIRTERIKM
ncbi:hypothetical protein [Tenacibaculum sp. 1_MG-2023]|uniref:hypothetical protein n=1 Tax=Tenacibaculum sp. 1_MG-2023 TaxID=3062653 RepID=UPI0026E18FB2|nr:hypothetical protein [Tenacibaculum sp. 1_MG-2023]MDO6600226.1 hypothetical protein [Tenacibaculum sp. 1_MG-2023]